MGGRRLEAVVLVKLASIRVERMNQHGTHPRLLRDRHTALQRILKGTLARQILQLTVASLLKSSRLLTLLLLSFSLMLITTCHWLMTWQTLE
jgi:hypothetical protein